MQLRDQDLFGILIARVRHAVHRSSLENIDAQRSKLIALRAVASLAPNSYGGRGPASRVGVKHFAKLEARQDGAVHDDETLSVGERSGVAHAARRPARRQVIVITEFDRKTLAAAQP